MKLKEGKLNGVNKSKVKFRLGCKLIILYYVTVEKGEKIVNPPSF